MNDYNEKRELIEAQLTDEALLMAKKVFGYPGSSYGRRQGVESWSRWYRSGQNGKFLGKPCLVLAQRMKRIQKFGPRVPGLIW